MKVHVVLWEVPYEGSELMGLYSTAAEAETAAAELHRYASQTYQQGALA